jgi:hypothetical protein
VQSDAEASLNERSVVAVESTVSSGGERGGMGRGGAVSLTARLSISAARALSLAEGKGPGWGGVVQCL